VLANYEVEPPDSFWKVFPYNSFPKDIDSPIDVNNLEFELAKNSKYLTIHEKNRAKSCIFDLKNGASSFQCKKLPSCEIENNFTTKIFGKEVTDTVAHWVKQGYAAGPFKEPPCKNFRANSILAIQQSEKVRTVLNLSVPKGFSYNDNVNEELLEKVHMSSAKKFAKTLVISGKGSKISKFDLVDAYKAVPCNINDLNLQGFKWINRFFVETKQIFGAKPAVPNFDKLGNTILSLVLAKSSIPRYLVHRTLDDVPLTCPPRKKWGEEFVSIYLELCKKFNVKVTSSCPKYEKAFTHSNFGKVLGVFFDSKNLKWQLPNSKVNKTLNCISLALNGKTDLLQFQQLLGRLNFSGQLSSFMKGFKFNLNKKLSCLQNNIDISSDLEDNVKKDLLVWANFLSENQHWYPIYQPHVDPPLACIWFMSDAAGCDTAHDESKKIGCGNIGFDCESNIVFMHQLYWDINMLTTVRDDTGVLLCYKTSFLEFIGILLPFIMIPHKLVNKYVIVKVDNLGCYFGWINRQLSGDSLTSILIRTLHLICHKISCEVHIDHIPRMSSPEAVLVDRLSREATTSEDDRKLLKKYDCKYAPKSFLSWLSNPVEDWDLPMRIIDEIFHE
jgi:hypothetical protein